MCSSDLRHALAADGRLVLGGDDRAAIGELKSGRGRIAIERDDEEGPLARGSQQAELGRAGP